MTKPPLPSGGAFVQVKMGPPDDQGRSVGKDTFIAAKEEGHEEEEDAPPDSALRSAQEPSPAARVS